MNHADLINVECKQDPVTGDWHLSLGCTVTPRRIFVDNITETDWGCRTHVYEERRPPRPAKLDMPPNVSICGIVDAYVRDEDGTLRPDT